MHTQIRTNITFPRRAVLCLVYDGITFILFCQFLNEYLDCLRCCSFEKLNWVKIFKTCY